MYFGWQSEDVVAEGNVTNIPFPSASSQVYQRQAPHPTPIRHHTAMSGQPVLLQPLPSTEFIVSFIIYTSYGDIVTHAGFRYTGNTEKITKFFWVKPVEKTCRVLNEPARRTSFIVQTGYKVTVE